MFLIYWIAIFIMGFGAISYFKIDKELEVKTPNDESRNEALKRSAIMVVIIGFIIAIMARMVLNWNLENL